MHRVGAQQFDMPSFLGKRNFAPVLGVGLAQLVGRCAPTQVSTVCSGAGFGVSGVATTPTTPT
jgi:hypothetical protein